METYLVCELEDSYRKYVSAYQVDIGRFKAIHIPAGFL